MYYIYKITNLKNKKCYIGITSTKKDIDYDFFDKKHPIYKRFKQHEKANSLIGNAIRKGNEDSFLLEQIGKYDINDTNFIKHIESRLILQNNSLFPYGYNKSLSTKYLENYSLQQTYKKNNADLYGISVDDYGSFSIDLYKEYDKCYLINIDNKWTNINKINKNFLYNNKYITYDDNDIKYVKYFTIKSNNLLFVINCYNKIIKKKYNINYSNYLIDYEEVERKIKNNECINYFLTKSQIFV